MKLIILPTILAALFIQESTQQCFRPSKDKKPNPSRHSNLYGGQPAFSLDLLHVISQTMPEGNLFFSPYSTYRALLIAYFMAGGRTEAELKNVLRLSGNLDKSYIYALYNLDKFMTRFGTQYEFISVNKMYASNEIAVKECVKHDFPDELQPFPFKTYPDGSRVAINSWVENATHHMITNLLPSDAVDSLTTLVLVNAASFKSIWENEFNRSLTRREVFYNSASQRTEVEMMHVEGIFRHDISVTLKCHILELPYQGKNISMIILLPAFSIEDSINATLRNLKKIFDKDSLISKTVHVALPKFELETTIELVPVLKAMGLTYLFQETAGLTALIEKGDVSLKNALHKAKIEVTEEGITGVAATVPLSLNSNKPVKVEQFICNHPFIYFMYDNLQKAVLFAGVFRG